MPLIQIPAGGRAVLVEAPPDILETARTFFPLATPADGGAPSIVVAEDGADRFRIGANGGQTPGDVIAAIRTLCVTPAPAPTDVAMIAGAVGWGERAVIVTGHDGAGVSSLVAWLVEHGFSYLSDDGVTIGEGGIVRGVPAPLAIPHASAAHVATLAAFRDAPTVRGGDRLMLAPDPTWLTPDLQAPAGLVLFVEYRRGVLLSLEPVPVTPWRLLEMTRDVVLPSDPGFAAIAAVAAKVPAVTVRYGHYAQLDGVVDFLCRTFIEGGTDPAEVGQFLSGLARYSGPAHAAPSVPQKHPVPARTDRALSPKMTIGMATYDDYDGVYFSLQAIRMYHPEVLAEVEFLVIDNHPDGPCAAPLKALENAAPNYRYVPAGDTTGTAIRDRVFAEAAGDFVLCMDCHVFIVPGAIRRLLDYFGAQPASRDLVQGPLVNDNLSYISTHFAPGWREGMYGMWANDDRGNDPNGPPFDIPMQGLGVFACRRDAWPGFNPAFRGFGGEEGYIHEKFRQRGGRTLCLPFLRWMHRFNRPMGIPYPNRWEDRFRNYLIGHIELGQPTADLETHMREKMGEVAANGLIEAVRREFGAELANAAE